MHQKVLSLNISLTNIKWLLVYLLFICPIGYNGNIQLCPIKSKNEDTLTQFLKCLGVHRSDMDQWPQIVPPLLAAIGRTDGQMLDIRLCEELC